MKRNVPEEFVKKKIKATFYCQQFSLENRTVYIAMRKIMVETDRPEMAV